MAVEQEELTVLLEMMVDQVEVVVLLLVDKQVEIQHKVIPMEPQVMVLTVEIYLNLGVGVQDKLDKHQTEEMVVLTQLQVQQFSMQEEELLLVELEEMEVEEMVMHLLVDHLHLELQIQEVVVDLDTRHQGEQQEMVEVVL